MASDPGSLSNLNDIVLAPAPSWWPPALGWYALIIVLLTGLIWSAYRLWLDFRCNRYRRAAMAELEAIEAEPGNLVCEHLAVLLKRTALHTFSREQVAALSGDSWRAFLDQHCEARPFSGEAGELLNKMAYQASERNSIDLQPLIEGIRTWIKHHQSEPC